MKVGIIGGGASGIFTALAIKRTSPNIEVTIIEKEKKLGRKLYATGNGRCNCYNTDLNPEKYNNPKFFRLIKGKGFDYSPELFDIYGIRTVMENGLVYPIFHDAEHFVRILEKDLVSNGIISRLGLRTTFYTQKGNGYSVECEGGERLYFDVLVFAGGGRSSPKLGSDGSLFQALREHGYLIKEPKPGLAPIRLKGSDFQSLKGIRHRANVSIVVNGSIVFEELGEVLYKEDGISGIVIFNAESFMVRNDLFGKATIHLDLFPGMSTYELDQIGKPSSLLVPSLERHILRKAKEENAPWFDYVKDVTYVPVGPYPFADSQVTIGGIDTDQVDQNLESKLERNIFFVGEALDIDGYCGGYNLAWAYISAHRVAEKIAKV